MPSVTKPRVAKVKKKSLERKARKKVINAGSPDRRQHRDAAARQEQRDHRPQQTSKRSEEDREQRR